MEPQLWVLMQRARLETGTAGGSAPPTGAALAGNAGVERRAREVFVEGAEPEERIRRLDLVGDLARLCRLGAVAFAEEFARRGIDFETTLREQRRVVPLVALLGRISPFFRHANHGLV
ncbi:MAG: hypothetical protein JSW65_06010, partial [Candidatus Bipolaricaulota bacterium]